jgi:hypothetical protein
VAEAFFITFEKAQCSTDLPRLPISAYTSFVCPANSDVLVLLFYKNQTISYASLSL